MSVLHFGRYRGRRIEDVPAEYLEFLAESSRRTLADAEAELERRANAAEADATMIQKIISAGYRSLAAKMHPDHGGDTRSMQELNAAMAALREISKQENPF